MVEKILDQLNNSKGIILDDIELIESLKVSKEINKAVNENINTCVRKQEKLKKGYNLYAPVSLRGVTLYFCI